MKYSILFIIYAIAIFAIVWSLISIPNFLNSSFGSHKATILSFSSFIKSISNTVFTKEVLFQFLFYTLFAAYMLPCIFIKKLKTWYLSMGAFLLILLAFTLFMINLLPENAGKFSARGNVVANFSTINGHNTTLVIMGILVVIALPLSYKLALKINSPKKYPA